MNRRRKTLFLILFQLCAAVGSFATGREWSADRFLKNYQETTVKMEKDYAGKVVSTVIRRESPCGGSRGVLYVHGYNDYFFQEEMGNRFVDSCWNFYAVDLRKYGRSLQTDQTPYQMRNISEYYADLDSAINVMAQNGIRDIVLMGHSTGGLVVASYMNNHPSPLIKAVILNSPFLDWNMGSFTEKVAIPMVSCIGRHFPNIKISQGESSPYGESLLNDYHGEWNFDTNLKTIKPRKVSAGWIRGISEAQAALRNHSFIKVPVLLMYSAKSIFGDKWTPEHQTGDAVLDVKDISRIGRTLGPDVTEISVNGGLHDLILSEKNVRNEVYNDIFNWLDNKVDL
ncbi:MAG: alpha/beta hydrolase [Muribaculaceae bacterium]|nr:alpha/beta hydrolase [Muribaculaceae bacterium]